MYSEGRRKGLRKYDSASVTSKNYNHFVFPGLLIVHQVYSNNSELYIRFI